MICGGCARPIREVEEGVWVRTGSDECEAGGVHSPPRPVMETEDVYLVRSRIGGSWWNDQQGWCGIGNATAYDLDDLAEVTLPLDGEWVRFSEVPF